VCSVHAGDDDRARSFLANVLRGRPPGGARGAG
jgi:hypothetical protein